MPRTTNSICATPRTSLKISARPLSPISNQINLTLSRGNGCVMLLKLTTACLRRRNTTIISLNGSSVIQPSVKFFATFCKLKPLTGLMIPESMIKNYTMRLSKSTFNCSWPFQTTSKFKFKTSMKMMKMRTRQTTMRKWKSRISREKSTMYEIQFY